MAKDTDTRLTEFSGAWRHCQRDDGGPGPPRKTACPPTPQNALTGVDARRRRRAHQPPIAVGGASSGEAGNCQ